MQRMETQKPAGQTPILKQAPVAPVQIQFKYFREQVHPIARSQELFNINTRHIFCFLSAM